jgi:hypothetical protein
MFFGCGGQGRYAIPPCCALAGGQLPHGQHGEAAQGVFECSDALQGGAQFVRQGLQLLLGAHVFLPGF